MIKVRIADVDQCYPSKGVRRKCRYCSGLLNKQNFKALLAPWNTILYESDNFIVVPTLGSLIEGWLLIISKEHYLCMGALPGFLHSELQELLDLISNKLIGVYGPPTVFEHGPSKEGEDMGCGIDHAHLHVVPLQFSLLAKAKVSIELHRFQWARYRHSFSSLEELFYYKKSYIYIKEPSCDGFYCIVDRVPCQALRRVIARELGMQTKYDYKKYVFSKNAEKTIMRIQNNFLDLKFVSCT